MTKTTWDPRPLATILDEAVTAAEKGDHKEARGLGKKARAACPDAFSAVYADRISYAAIDMEFRGSNAYGVRRAARLTQIASGLPITY